MVLHYCKFCNGVVLYASQNDPTLAESGLYDHGQYPFVFDPLFVEEDSPAGFGYKMCIRDRRSRGRWHPVPCGCGRIL